MENHLKRTKNARKQAKKCSEVGPGETAEKSIYGEKYSGVLASASAGSCSGPVQNNDQNLHRASNDSLTAAEIEFFEHLSAE